MSEFRVGRVSSVNYAAGTARVTYEDRDNEVTAELPILSNGEYRMPAIGSMVTVLHLSEGVSSGVIAGEPWNGENVPPVSGKGVYHKALDSVAYIHCEDGNVTIHDKSGDFSINDILERLDRLERGQR